MSPNATDRAPARSTASFEPSPPAVLRRHSRPCGSWWSRRSPIDTRVRHQSAAIPARAPLGNLFWPARKPRSPV